MQTADNTSHVSSPYGRRSDPMQHRMAFHAGLDIAAPIGSPVVAAADGTVEAVGLQARLGRFVKIRHDDHTETLYGHLGDVQVSEGESVSAGQSIGHIGLSGRTTGPHLHFALMKDSDPVDPLPQLAAAMPVKTMEVSDARQ